MIDAFQKKLNIQKTDKLWIYWIEMDKSHIQRENFS